VWFDKGGGRGFQNGLTNLYYYVSFSTAVQVEHTSGLFVFVLQSQANSFLSRATEYFTTTIYTSTPIEAAVAKLSIFTVNSYLKCGLIMDREAWKQLHTCHSAFRVQRNG
jgi:hypothetical protein